MTIEKRQKNSRQLAEIFSEDSTKFARIPKASDSTPQVRPELNFGKNLLKNILNNSH